MSMLDVNLSSDGIIPESANAPACENFFDDDLRAQTASFNSNNQPAPFRLLGSAALPPQHASSAVVVSCPHAGRYYPDALINAGAIGIEALRDLEDFAVDRLLGGLSHTSIGGISSNIARAYLDVNRPDDALDQNMFSEPVTAAKRSPKVLAGYGLLPRLTGARTPIHNRLLSAKEARRRIKLAYRPYHTQLKKLLDDSKEANGRYLLVDCHSMPAVDHQNRQLPDIVLGDCHGRTLATDVRKQLDDYIQMMGYTVAWNTPYSGGFITGHYGDATSNCQSLQIEINRKLYMRPEHQLDKDGAVQVKGLLTSLLKFLDLSIG